MEAILSLLDHPDVIPFSEVIQKGTVTTRKHIIMLARHQNLPTLLENLDENFSMARYAWTPVLVTREP
jgi:hypothetical protein